MAPAIFQKIMDMILQGMPEVIRYIDNILITGKTEVKHLNNPGGSVAEAPRVWTTKSKSEFMHSGVKYVGHRIDAKGFACLG